MRPGFFIEQYKHIFDKRFNEMEMKSEMKPVSISEQLLFNTVRLQTKTGSGTGFFYNFKIGDKIVPTIITNKHVVNNKQLEEVTFYLHFCDNDNDEPTSNNKIMLKTPWYFHPTKDLCFTFINPVITAVEKQQGKKVFYKANDESIIPTQDQLNDLNALEELVMVGYPIGLWDERNNFPIFRKGFTASHPAIDFNEDGIGLVDMACFPGSSGSPIYILNEGGYKDKKGNLQWGKSRIYFIGILFAGPVTDAEGDIYVREIPTAQQKLEAHTSIMTNLGYYIKASELNAFKPIIEKEIRAMEK